MWLFYYSITRAKFVRKKCILTEITTIIQFWMLFSTFKCVCVCQLCSTHGAGMLRILFCFRFWLWGGGGCAGCKVQCKCDVSKARVTCYLYVNGKAVRLDLSYQLQFKKIFFKTRNSVKDSCQLAVLLSRAHIHTHTEGSTQWNVTANEKLGYIEVKPLRMGGCDADTRRSVPWNTRSALGRIVALPSSHPNSSLIAISYDALSSFVTITRLNVRI
jgi:hypothetical protein